MDEPARTAFEPEDRELCPDGACIGVIGPDGRCKECGLAGLTSTLDPRAQGLRSEEEISDEVEAHVVAYSTPAAPDDFEDRLLCSDGGCIGILGPEGCCTECGLRPDGAQ